MEKEWRFLAPGSSRLLHQDMGPWMPTLDFSREAANPDFRVKSFCIYLPGLP